jgi:aminoglycoside 6'-N-acetyltransferase
LVNAAAPRFRPLGREDFGLLSSWLAEPHVARWWREPGHPAAVEARYGPSVDGRDPTELFIIEVDDQPVGFIQRYESRDEPEWQRTLESAGLRERAIGIDYLIGRPEHTGSGLGPMIIEAFVRECWCRYPDAVVVAVAVQQENRPSWRALEKADFRRAWSGELDSEDLSDDGPSYLYLLGRPDEPTAAPGLTESGGPPPR